LITAEQANQPGGINATTDVDNFLGFDEPIKCPGQEEVLGARTIV
jgi:hypothetical protein